MTHPPLHQHCAECHQPISADQVGTIDAVLVWWREFDPAEVLCRGCVAWLVHPLCNDLVPARRTYQALAEYERQVAINAEMRRYRRRQRNQQRFWDEVWAEFARRRVAGDESVTVGQIMEFVIGSRNPAEAANNRPLVTSVITCPSDITKDRHNELALAWLRGEHSTATEKLELRAAA